MKTRRFTTILTSAYVSAMLATSVAPIRSDATLAAAIDPMAAQKALQTAVNGLDATGWLAASTAGTPPAAQPTPKVIPAPLTPKADPVMTEELMARLIKYTRAGEGVGSITPRLCAVLGLCDGTKEMPLKMGKSDLTDKAHYFALPVDADSKDILILVLTPNETNTEVVNSYLTDKTGKLRAAGISDKAGVRLITNEKAEASFKAELAIFAKEAADLPPAGTTVAGNS